MHWSIRVVLGTAACLVALAIVMSPVDTVTKLFSSAIWLGVVAIIVLAIGGESHSL